MYPTNERKSGYVVWHCRCDCGNEIDVDYRKLMRDTAVDCGCNSVKARRDLRGKRFGKLIVLNETDQRKYGTVVWHCKCDCGNYVDAPQSQLVKGYRRSCGCLSNPPRKDWIGSRFGMLEVVAYEGKEKGCHLWKCHCDCGKEVVVRQSNLQIGHTASCGCQVDIKKNVHFVEGTSVEHIASKKVFSSNTSGYRGVYQNKRNSRWVAQITFKGKTYYLGSYERIEDAVEIRKKAETELFDGFLEKYQKKREEKPDLEKVDADELKHAKKIYTKIRIPGNLNEKIQEILIEK